jgi:hypothetical protein
MYKVEEVWGEEALTEVLSVTKEVYENRERFVPKTEGRYKRILNWNKPGTKVFLVRKNGKPAGHLSVIPNPQMQYEKYSNIATVGFYECINDPEAAKVLLERAEKYAKEELKADYLVGPVDYATWFEYRFIHPSPNPQIYSEPFNPDHYIPQFEDFGFGEIASFQSSITEKPIIYKHYDRVEKKFKENGVEIRTMDFFTKDHLKEFYELEKICWSRQFLYMDIPYEEYHMIRQKLPETLNKDLSFAFVHPEYGIFGFIYAYEDFYDPTGKTIMIKSIGSLMKRDLAGIGGYTTTLMHKKAFGMGYERIIHALMRTDNMSAAAKSFNDEDKMQVYKQYSLYGKPLV